jgi:hypothetical protein
VWLHVFLTVALDWGEWLHAPPALYQRKEPSVTWVYLRHALHDLERKNHFFVRTGKQNEKSGSPIQHAGPYTYWAIPAFLKHGGNGICDLLWGTGLHILPSLCRPVLHTHTDAALTGWPL